MAAGNPEAAGTLLQGEIDADEMAPVDHAWLHLQLARAHQELANLGETRRAATLSLAIGATSATTSPPPRSAASLPRSCSTSHLSRSPTSPAPFVTTTQRSPGGAHRPPTAARSRSSRRLSTAPLGSHGQWRHFSGLLARQEFIDPHVADANALADHLGVLRRAGAERAAARATWWVTINGPADAVAAATCGINLTRSTSNSVVADLAMLRVAAGKFDLPGSLYTPVAHYWRSRTMRRRALSVISTAGRGGRAYCLAWAVAGGLAVSAFAQAPAAYGWPALIEPISLSSHAGSEEPIELQLYPRGHETAWKVSLDCPGPLCQGSGGRLPADSAALQAATLLRAH